MGRAADRRLGGAGVPLLLLMAGGCEGAALGAGVVRTDSAGAEIVLSQGADHPLLWSFEAVGRLGGAEDGPEAFFELGEWLVDSDAAGRIYVLDVASARVAVFDAAGEHLRSMGRRGAGPGEMLEPMALSVDRAEPCT